MKELLKQKMEKLVAILASGFHFFSISQAPYLEWANAHQSASSWGLSIFTDANNNIYTTGLFFYDTLFVTTTTGTDTLISPSLDDNCFVQKQDPNGNVLWARAIESTGESMGKAVSVDNDGNVYVVGAYSAMADFDPGPDTYYLNSPAVSEIFIWKLDADGNLIWVKTMTGTMASYGSIANDIVIQDSILIITGDYNGTVDFDPGPLTDYYSTGGLFVQKLDTAGNLIWVKSIDGNNSSDANSLSVDLAGNIYVGGTLRGTLDFDPGPADGSITSITSYPDAFLLKINQFGNFEWVNITCGSIEEYGEDILVDKGQNVYFLGRFFGTTDFDPGSNNEFITSDGGQDIFIQKFDSLGNLMWVRTIGDVYYDYGKAIAADSLCNIYLSGYFSTSTDISPGGIPALYNSAGFSDFFIEKMDSAGNYNWGTVIGGISADVAEDIAIDANTNVVITGKFYDTLDFDPTSSFYNVGCPQGNAFVAIYKEGYAGMTENNQRENVHVYPNPAQDLIWLSNIDENTEVIIMDLNSRIIYTTISENSAVALDVSNFERGIYLVQINYAGDIVTKKIALQ